MVHQMNVIKAKEAEDGRRLHEEAQEEEADSSSEGEDEEERKQRQEEMLVKSFDYVRPNPMSRRQRLEERCASKGGCSAEEVNTEHHNTKIYPVDFMQRMFSERLLQPSSSSFAAAAASSANTSNNPYFTTSLHQLSSTSTSTADKLKIIQLEAANESMKKMLEKLVTVNADLEGQNAHLIHLVGQLAAENSALKRNNMATSHQAHNQWQGFAHPYNRSQVRDCDSERESEPRKEEPPQKKRPRVLADPWAKRPYRA